MNFLFATNSPSNTSYPAISHTLACNTATSTATAGGHVHGSSGPVSPTTNGTVSSLQDIELVIDIESSFHGVLLGLPEESTGAVLNATAILHVRKKPIRASKLTATFDGRIKVQCSDGATFGPEQYRERVLAHKDWVLWEAGGSNTHNVASGSGSKNHIPVGTHYYPLSIQLDGALPPTFSGKHGSIRYILSSTLFRPLFYSDINAVQEIEIKRCLVSETSQPDRAPSQLSAQLDLGSLLLNQLSRAGISGALNDQSTILNAHASDLPMGPTTITHHNTHKELLRYTASSPPIAHLEGGLIHVDLALEPLPPGSYIYSIAYGLKEAIYYQSSASGNLTDNKSEILYPIGQQTVIIPRDHERERVMSSAGAGASTRQLLELRPCPLLTNVDIMTPLIEIQHRITCNVAIVLPDPIRRRNTLSGRGDQSNNQSGGTSGGGGILRRLNLAPQPLPPSLNLVDSTGTEVANNAVLLGEPTLSIMEPASMPVTVALNDAPPPPTSLRIESTLLEFPVILTSRFPSASKVQQYPAAVATADPLTQSQEFLQGNESGSGSENDFRYQALSTNSHSSPPHSTMLQQFVHNQEIAPTIIPTTGTTVQVVASSTMSPGVSASSSSSPSTFSSQLTASDRDTSSSSSHASPLPPQTLQRTMPTNTMSLNGSLLNMGTDAPIAGSGQNYARVPVQSGISAGLRAVAAAAASAGGSTTVAGGTEPTSRPPSYGRQMQRPDQGGDASPEEPPKYEDVIEDSSAPSETGLGITMPHAIPMPMPMQVPCRGNQATSPRAVQLSYSPVMHYNMSSLPRGRAMASPSFSSPISPSANSPLMMPGCDGQGSSPQMIQSHPRTGSMTSTSLLASSARSQGQLGSILLTMAPTQPSSVQQQTVTGGASIHRQGSMGHIGHQRQQQQHRGHHRQRSVGAATIMGSLGRNGGYLSQQPSPLTMADCVSAMPIASPPAYVE
ncbi:Arrestin domain-containing protein 2 [Haplosporangium sp. Z 767]|nr:Arrestin domain-containing protein 2 [Haplosporangium sp. Z 767]